jgi:hypothetical protein
MFQKVAGNTTRLTDSIFALPFAALHPIAFVE